MSHRTLPILSTVIALVLVMPVPAVSQLRGDTSEVPRDTHGRPDLSGVWDFRTATPFQRPEGFGERLTEEQAAAIEAGAAAADLLAAARPEDGEVGLLVSTMVHGNRELIAGLVRDEQFGPCVMLGLGGILAEAVADVAFRLAPLEHGDALDLIDDLGAQSLLGEFRGEPAVDREALADTLMALSRIAADSDIRSVDLNPLIVVEGRPVAVDALVETA